jgi:energy-coupling factor transport system ATP-binding protein
MIHEEALVSILFSDVTFTYLHSEDPAVANINLEIQEKSITAILGQVSAGKSTLLRMMDGLVPNHLPGYMKGKVTVDGIDTQTVEVPQLAQMVNLVFDDPVLQIVSLTVEDDVAFGPANLALPRDEVRARVAEALNRTRLTGLETRNPRSLSGGQQQLLAIAGVLAMRPKYLVLDEPVAMLDPVGKSQVLRAIKDLHDEFGLTVVIAESGADIEAVLQFVDRVVALEKGRIIFDGDPHSVLANREEIARAGLRVPQVTELAYHLREPEEKTVPLTLQEGAAYVRQRVASPLRIENSSAGNTSAAAPGEPSGQVAPVEAAGGVISVRDLWHTYPTLPPTHALKGVNLEIRRGEMVALLGQNGAGKTTFAFHLVGALKPTRPESGVEVAGLDVVKVSQYDIIQKANYVFQNPANQLFCDNFASEVSFGPQRLELPPEEVEKRAREALEQVGLGQFWDESTFDIPKSMETLLGLASVLSLKPQILIVDEPTGGLDLSSGKRVMEILDELNRRGVTIVIITHDMALAARYARRVILLKDGQVLADSSTGQVFSQPELLAQAMLHPPQITMLAQSLQDLGLPPDILTVEDFLRTIQPAISSKEEV